MIASVCVEQFPARQSYMVCRTCDYTDLPIGRLDRALSEARAKGWIIADMKQDWKTIFPFGSRQDVDRWSAGR